MPDLRATPGRVVTLVIGLPLMLASVAWGAFSVIGTLARTSEHHHASYAWSGGTIALDMGDGNVRIRAGKVAALAVDYTAHYEFQRPTVGATVSASGISLRSRCVGSIFGQNCSVNYVITVPEQAPLRLHLGDGDVNLEAIAGSVVVQSRDGHISGLGLLSKRVQVSSGDGGVHLQWVAAPTDVNLRMGDGNIDLTVPTGSGPYAVRQSGSGGSDITVATDLNAPATMVLRSGDGNVHVHYPAP